eukprot:1339662-Amorphochlora_amoeboformis.AAC.2
MGEEKDGKDRLIGWMRSRYEVRGRMGRMGCTNRMRVRMEWKYMTGWMQGGYSCMECRDRRRKRRAKSRIRKDGSADGLLG